MDSNLADAFSASMQPDNNCSEMLYARTSEMYIVFARDSIYAKRAYAIAIPSVRPSVCLSVRLSDCHTGDSCKNGCS